MLQYSSDKVCEVIKDREWVVSCPSCELIESKSQSIIESRVQSTVQVLQLPGWVQVVMLSSAAHITELQQDA